MARKPKLSYPEQVQHLEQKGVSFALMSKRQALIYLRDNNNFFKLSSYSHLSVHTQEIGLKSWHSSPRSKRFA